MTTDTAFDPDRQAARRTWETNAELRGEFGNEFERYFAYLVAVRDGRVKVLGGQVVSQER